MMLRLFPFRCCLFAVLLFCWPAKAPAQQQMPLPPTELAASPPPDPSSLPAPPPVEWDTLGPKDSGEGLGEPLPIEIPPPQPDIPIAPPPAPVIETPLSDGPSPEELEFAKPEVEVWREESISPQVPPRETSQLAQAYVTGAEPVWLRVQFNPQAAGKNVYIMPGRGLTLNPPDAVLQVSPTGECIVLAELHENVLRTHVIFYCEGVKTVLPVVRGTQAQVEAKEEEVQ